jgi:hypothetical protein
MLVSWPAVLQALQGRPDKAKPVKIRQSRNAESR